MSTKKLLSNGQSIHANKSCRPSQFFKIFAGFLSWSLKKRDRPLTTIFFSHFSYIFNGSFPPFFSSHKELKVPNFQTPQTIHKFIHINYFLQKKLIKNSFHFSASKFFEYLSSHFANNLYVATTIHLRSKDSSLHFFDTI